MNRDRGAYQLSDIYDVAIAKTTTSGDQKIGGLLQRPRKMCELLDIETDTGKVLFGCDIRTL